MQKVKLICLVTVMFVNAVKSFKILGVLPYPGRSHVAPFLPMFEALALNGHNVTVISYFPRDKPLPNYKDFDLKGNLSQLSNIISIGEYDPEWRLTKYLNPLYLQDLMRMTCDAGLNSVQFLEFMKSETSFDLIVMEFFKEIVFWA